VSAVAPVTAAIVDDHPIATEGLERLLRESGFRVLPRATAVEHLEGEADVVVCDLHLPGRSGAGAISHLVARGYRVLATSGVAGREEVLDVVAAGARGYIPKTAAAAVFVHAVGQVAAGSHYVSAELANHLRGDAELRRLDVADIDALGHEVLRCFEQGDLADEVAVQLSVSRARLDAILAGIWDAAARRRRRGMPSPRERDVMRLVVRGLSHKQIAADLSIALLTVPTYLNAIKVKYLASHPHAQEQIAPLTAARLWAVELGIG
jgi:DNA-binding NarL/FixJ family response regulator